MKNKIKMTYFALIFYSPFLKLLLPVLTLFSAVRCIIEKSIDQSLRHYTNFSRHQRGFVSGLPGTHINASIVNGVLRAAKSNKKSCNVVMLDLAKAFDTCICTTHCSYCKYHLSYVRSCSH
jgi:hypothetical protein